MGQSGWGIYHGIVIAHRGKRVSCLAVKSLIEVIAHAIMYGCSWGTGHISGACRTILREIDSLLAARSCLAGVRKGFAGMVGSVSSHR